MINIGGKMDNKCWFCDSNEAIEEKSYTVSLRKHDNRKDQKIIKIDRCNECASKHRKGDIISNIMYALEVVMVAVAYFVFKIDFVYVIVGYLLLRRLLSMLSVKVRHWTAQPFKSVCVIADNEEVKKALEEGYIESRKF